MAFTSSHSTGGACIVSAGGLWLRFVRSFVRSFLRFRQKCMGDFERTYLFAQMTIRIRGFLWQNRVENRVENRVTPPDFPPDFRPDFQKGVLLQNRVENRVENGVENRVG